MLLVFNFWFNLSEVIKFIQFIIFLLLLFLKAEAIAIVIDVSPSMCVAADGEKTALQKCITAANMIVQRKVSSFSLNLYIFIYFLLWFHNFFFLNWLGHNFFFPSVNYLLLMN